MKVSSHIDQYLGPGTSRTSRTSRRPAIVCAAGRMQLAANVGYAIAERAESIIRRKRHGSTAADPNTLSVGDSNVLS